MESESQSESHDGEGQGEDGLAGTGASTDPFSSKWQNLTTHRTNNQSREPNVSFEYHSVMSQDDC